MVRKDRRRTAGLAAVVTLTLAAVLGLGVAITTAGQDDVSAARAATARYNSTVQAERAGYGPFPAGVPLAECIMALDGTAGMGFHWLNPNLLDGQLDPTKPEVLVYAPRQNGKLQLVALEYVVFDDAWAGSGDPTLFGRTLTKVEAPNRYAIPTFWQVHLWLYEPNSSGLFADFNPSVSC
jgi:hypothetical protein